MNLGTDEEPSKSHPFDPRYPPIAPLALPDRADCNYIRPHETVELILMGKELGPRRLTGDGVGVIGSGPLERGVPESGSVPVPQDPQQVSKRWHRRPGTPALRLHLVTGEKTPVPSSAMNA